VGKRAPKPEDQKQGRYVYCVIPSVAEKKSFGNIGFNGQEVYTMDYKDFSPIVSDAEMREYAVSEEEVEVHKKVVEQVMLEYDVLPVAYGMIFKNKKLLTIAMGAGYAAIKKASETVGAKIELGVKVFMPKELDGWNGQKEICRSDYLDGLKGIAADFKELKLFSERLVLNAAFLVDRSNIDEFSVRVGELTSRYDQVKTQYSGPWPPYNFVDIHILGKQRKGFR